MNPELMKKLQVATFIIVLMSNSAAHRVKENDTAHRLFGEERSFLEGNNDLFKNDSFEDSLGLDKTLDGYKSGERREYLPTEEKDEEND